MQFLSDFADLAVILPAFLAVTLTLFASGWRQGAVPWAWVVAGTLTLVFLAKLATYTLPGLLGPAWGPWSLRSPSGHVASAAILYGGLSVLLLRRRMLALALALAVAVLVAASRVALRAHTIPDVIAGGALGLAGVVALAWLAPPVPDRAGGARLVLPAVLASVVLLMHGERLTAEGMIMRLAWRLSRLLDS
jgi:membrane-associated phospholipid phosphatase